MEVDFDETTPTAKRSDSWKPLDEDRRAVNVAAIEVDYCDDELNTAQLDPQSADVDYSSYLQLQQPMFLDPDCNTIIEHHRLRRQRAVKARKAHRRSNRARSLNRDELASALCPASESLLVNTSQRSVSADDILSPSSRAVRITSAGGRADCNYSTDDELQLSPSDRTSSRSDTSTCVSVESEPTGGGHQELKVSRSHGSRGSYEGQLSLLGCRVGGDLSGGINSCTLTNRRKTCFELKDRLLERCDGKHKTDFERKFSMQVEYFSLNFDVSGAEKTTMIASADRGVTLGQAIADPLKDLGINIDRVSVYLESSHTALPLNSDCFRLAGSTLHVRAKDEDRRDSASSAGPQSAAAAAAAAPMMTCNKSNSSSVNSNLAGIGSMTRDRRQSAGVKLRKNASPCDDGGGSGNGNSGGGGGSIGAGDVSPCGTLSRVGAINTSDIQKYRAAVSARPHNKLQSLFSTFGKTQDKQEQLNELLTGYSLNGLPRMPDLLTLGRPHYDPSAFHLERHWTDIVDDTDSLNKRQRDQQEAIWELLTTEVEYIQKLRAIIDVFMCCLFDLQNEQILNEVDSDKLFSNICDVYYATCHFWVNHMSQVLRQARETRELLDPCLLKAGFLVFDKIFQSYTKYCLEQEICREYIKTNTKDNELFGTFIRWGETQKQCNRLKLVDLIVKPWQRLMKYKLLLYAIRKPLDKMDSSPDVEEQRNDITEMMEQVEKFVHHVNMELRQRHEYKQLALIIDRIESYDAVDMPSEECVKLVGDFCKIDLTCPVPGCGQQESRVLLLEGNLKLKDTYSKTDVYCFLFTDMLLITKPAAKRGDKVKIIKPPMRLDKIIVYSLRDATSFMLLYLNEYHMAQAVYTLHGDSKLWLENVAKAQNEYKEKRNRHLVPNESMLLDVYDDVDDDFGSQMQPDLIATGRHESDSVADSFLPNCPAPVYRSISCADSIASSFADSALHSETSLSRPHSATALTQHDSMLSRHSSSSSSSDHLRVPKQSYGSEAFSAAPGEPRLKMAHRTLRYGDRVETKQAGDEVGVDENVDAVRTRLNQRRALRTERRYHTADTIRELRHSRDNTIHKRLSLNYSSSATSAAGARMDSDNCSRLEPTSAFSCESVHSIPSSSGVSSTASLCRTGDISEETVDDVASVGSVRTSESTRKTSDIGRAPTSRADDDDNAGSVKPQHSLLSPTLYSDGDRTNSLERPLNNSLSDENHRLQLMIAERRRMNQELLLSDPHLEASEV